jgi:Tfp pilus assembly protein FimT
MRAKGFTLVELAIIMVLVGILVGVGASMIGPLTKRAKLNETRDIVNGAVEAVVGFAAPRNRVPDLTASPSATSFWTNVRTQNDAWARQLVYVFDNNLATSICGRTTTNITVRTCNDSGCTTFTDVLNVAFLVFSVGDNSVNQTYAAGSAAIGAPTTILTYPVGVTVGGLDNDDVAKWLTLSELQMKMACVQQQCTAYQIYNNLGATNYFRTNGLACLAIANNALISSIAPGGAINGYADAACTLAATPASIIYATVATADANRNCMVNYTGTDR